MMPEFPPQGEKRDGPCLLLPTYYLEKKSGPILEKGEGGTRNGGKQSLFQGGKRGERDVPQCLGEGGQAATIKGGGADIFTRERGQAFRPLIKKDK